MISSARRPVLLLAALLACAIVIALTAAFWNYTQDDVFITYVFSRNIAHGLGFVFNPGEHVQGSTTPLYALLMSVVYRITPDLLHAGNALSAFFLLAACGFAVLLTRAALSRFGRGAIVLLLITSPPVYVSFGMETLLYVMLLMLGLWLWSDGRRPWAMVAAAALTWTRADGAVLGAAFGLAALWEIVEAWQSKDTASVRGLLLDGLKLGAVYLAAALPWFIFAWAYFGSPLPQTFAVKQGLFEGIAYLTQGWRHWGVFYDNNPLSLLAVPLAAVGALKLARTPGLRPVALWPWLYAAGYTALNTTEFWYYTPAVAGLILLAVVGAETAAQALIRRLEHPRARLMVITASCLLIILCAVPGVQRALAFSQPSPRILTYRLAGEWLRANTPPEATVMVGDLGIVGYHAERRTFDTPGLIVPGLYFPGSRYAIARFKADYVVATSYFGWQEVVSEGWFTALYRPVTQISTPGDPFSPITIYQRRLPAPGEMVDYGGFRAPARAFPGRDLAFTCTVTLAEGEAPPIQTRVQVINAYGAIVAEGEQLFLLGQRPPDPAPGPETLEEQITLTLPPGLPTGRYGFVLDCGGQNHEGVLNLRPPEESTTWSPLAAYWEDGFVRLAGIDAPEGFSGWAGGTFGFALGWEAPGPAPADYHVFVHIVDAGGALVAQADGPPPGPSPNTWQAGTRILDQRTIALPASLAAGDYTVRLGWYDWESGERIPLANGADALTLPAPLILRAPGGSGTP
ncbi:MAG: hypothetical protein IT326_08025 [Anaerolineae bacterium]|nr:hypothetical protein [Anaerolineae bacterium]